MKRKIYFWVKKHINSDTVKVAMLAVPLAVILVQQIAEGTFSWTDFFDVTILVTFVFLAICDAIAKLVKKNVSIIAEDSAKLNNDYEKLAKKYKCTNLVKYNGVVYPEECLWLRSGNENIIIEDNCEKYYSLPSLIADNSQEIMEVHSASTVYNQINIRLDDFRQDADNNCVVLNTSRTQYFDSLLTNRACDYVLSKKKVTIRELYEPGPFLKPLSLSKMSNHLGFNGFVITSDTKTIPFILRNKNLSIAKGLWATSIGASLKTMYALDFKDGFMMNENSLSNAIIGEVHDELYISDDTALNNDKVEASIFAFYRDLVECGKPQFLFCLQLENTTEAELQKLITKKRNKKESTTAGCIL